MKDLLSLKRLDQILSNKLSQHFGLAGLFKSRLPQRQIKNYQFNAHSHLIRPHFYRYDLLEFSLFLFSSRAASGPPARRRFRDCVTFKK